MKLMDIRTAPEGEEKELAGLLLPYSGLLLENENFTLGPVVYVYVSLQYITYR